MRWGRVGVKDCPPGVGGVVSPFGVAEKTTMTPSIGFTCLTNGSPAVTVASERLVFNGRGWTYGASQQDAEEVSFMLPC